MYKRLHTWTLTLLGTLALAGAAGAQQPGTGGDTSGNAPASPPAESAAPQIPIQFRGLSGGEALRLAPAGGTLEDREVRSDGTAQTDLTAGQAYDLQWGAPDHPEKFSFYVPKPAEGAAPSTPVQIQLRHGMRGVPERVWNAYRWAAGENDQVARYTPPPAPAPAPKPTPPVETPRVTPAPVVTAPPVAITTPPSTDFSSSSATAAVDELRSQLQLARLLAILGMALAFLTVIGGIAFYASVWQPHRAAMAQALERTLPDALRAQSQDVAALGRRLDAARQQWEQEREALRRGQELLASHPARGSDPVRDELAQLRRQLDDLRRQLPPGGRSG